MAIAYQGSGNASAFPSTSCSTTITTTGASVTIVLFAFSSLSTVNAPTFNGVAFTQVRSYYQILAGPSAGSYVSAWVLPNASIGASLTLQLTQGSSANFGFGASWYSGAKGVQPDASIAYAETATALPSQTLTTIADNSWTVLLGQQSGTPSSGTATLRQSSIGFIADSNAAITPAGSSTLNINSTASTSQVYLMLSLAPMLITDQVVAAYKLSDTSDYSGNSRNLTNTGSTTFGAGLIGNAATFGTSNTTKFLRYTGTTGIAATDDWTMAWFFRTSTNNVISSAMRLVYGGGTKGFYFIWDGAGGVAWDIFPDAGGSMSVAGTVTNNTWYSIILSCTAGTITCYINNVSIGTVAIGTTSGKTDGINTDGQANAWFYNGDLDLLYVWNRALSASERTTLYNGGSGYELVIGSSSSAMLSFF